MCAQIQDARFFFSVPWLALAVLHTEGPKHLNPKQNITYICNGFFCSLFYNQQTTVMWRGQVLCVYLSVCAYRNFAPHLWPAAALSHSWAEILRGFHSRTGLIEVEICALFLFLLPVSFVNVLLCPYSLAHVVALSISVNLPQSRSPSLFLTSFAARATTGHLGTCCGILPNLPTQRSSFPSRCCFLP